MSDAKFSYKNQKSVSVKILLIQLRRIGDVLMTTPSIRALRHSFPQAHIAFLTEKPSDQLLHHNPHVDEVLLYSKPKSFKEMLVFLKMLRHKKFECIIDFFGNPRTAWISLLSGAGVRIGFDFRGRRWAYTERIAFSSKRTYAAEDKLLLLKPLGIQAASSQTESQEQLQLEFPISDEDRDYATTLFEDLDIQDAPLIISLSPVSRQPYKVWPASNFAALADQLITEFGAKILFIYGPNEEHFVEAVRESMQETPLPNYPVPSLSETRAIMEKVHLHFGNDNGPRHFAIAAKTPTLAVFGRPWAANWTPPHQNLHCAVEYDPGCKDNCTYPQCDHLNCIQQLPIEKVRESLLTQLSELNISTIKL